MTERRRLLCRYSELQVKLYACQVILAFEYLQSLDIVYRDLKPENILIDPAGNLKVSRILPLLLFCLVGLNGRGCDVTRFSDLEPRSGVGQS